MPAPVYHPSGPAPAVAAPGRAPLLKRDTVGAFEARLRWSARWRWLGPALAAVLVLGVVAGVLALRRRAQPAASRAHAEALAQAALDDAASVDGAIARLDERLRQDRSDRPAIADRALAQVLRAAAIVDEGEAVAARLAARSAERDRIRREQPAGWEERERTLSAEIGTLQRDVRAHEEKARALSHSAFESLRSVEGAMGERIELLRGLAAYHALGGERDRALKAIRAARDRGVADGWIALAEAWVDVRDPDRAGRERALARLGALSSAHPEILRARYLLARTQAALGRRGEALATVDGVLAANAQHEGAKRLRADLSAAGDDAARAAAMPRATGEAAAPATRASEGAAGAVKPGTTPRKPIAQPDTPAVRPAAAPSAPDAGPAPAPAPAETPPAPAVEPAPAPDAALPAPPAQPLAAPQPPPGPPRRVVEDVPPSGGG